jgi:hypothetical protein
MTSRALVPLDQPYGTRGATEQAIGQAVPAAPTAPPDMLMATRPTRQAAVPDILAQLAQPPAPPNRDQRLREIRDTTPNAIVAELLTRLLGD